MATAPKFTNTARLASVAVSAANTNRDGTGTIVEVIAGVAPGTRIEVVRVKATVTTTAGMIRLYLSLDSGSTWKLYDEIVVSAITVAAGTAGFTARVPYQHLVLPGTAYRLGASTHNAEAFQVSAFGGDLD